MNNLKATYGRVLLKVDTQQKNKHTFDNGVTIQLERDVENLDKKYTAQTLGECVHSEYIPVGAMVLFHHNSLHPVNEIQNHSQLSGENIASGIKIYSVPEVECYLWKMPGSFTWNSTKGFCTALRVFEPYKGTLNGIEPTKIKNVLYLTSGEYQWYVVHTVKAADYPVTFRNETGKDETIIRCRHFENEENEREEIIGIAQDLTEKLKNKQLLIGLEPKDAKYYEC